MKLPISRPTASRTLGTTVLRVLVPRAILFGLTALVLLLGRVMAMEPSSAEYQPLPTLQPVWSLTEQAAEPDCVRVAEWPTGEPGSEVVVHRFSDDSTVRLSFDTAWAQNHNSTESDDLYVLGVCP